MATLYIDIDENDEFSQQSGGPAGAVVDKWGNIDLSGCTETDIDIVWTLTTEGRTFKNNGLKIKGKGWDAIFTDKGASDDDTQWTIEDKNPQAGDGNPLFWYEIKTSSTDIDPGIKNRS